MKAKRLVVVDDQTMLLDVLERQFDGEKAVELTGVASDAATAIELIETSRPDIVMLDIDLGSDASGFDVLRAVRANPGLTVRVVMVSMFDNPMYRNRAFELGADAYATKGVRFETLKALLLDDRSYKAPKSDWGKFWRNGSSASSSSVLSLPFKSLSEKELLVVRRVADGVPEKQIGIETGISVSSVATYLRRAMRKLGVSTRAELFRVASPVHFR